MAVRTITTVAELHAAVDDARRRGCVVGLVPTMGALHEGHASLIRAAVLDGCNEILTTIFVNPLQFGKNEDLSKYPRTFDDDTALAGEAGATIVFAPSVREMYGDAPVLTNVSVRVLTETLDGVARPGHFDGVATVVAKLFAMTGACRAYFGEKDYQQLAVIRRMASDLSFPITIVGCPIIREPNGLAMSSRNRYLTADERERASVIKRALDAGAALVAQGATAKAVCTAMRELLEAEPVVASIDYVACVDRETLIDVEAITSECRLLVACRVGAARLIDNRAAHPGNETLRRA